jgi:alpha-D-ribose 1-methylphosphonate 5-triphosphate synthase subunit PhnI
MGYSSVRGGLDAIGHAERLIASAVTNTDHEVGVEQVPDHLELLLHQVMGEGGVYDPELGALAVKQAEGDPLEAGFLLRAYRTTLPRLGYSVPSSGRDLRVVRRISSAFRDIPGGQLLGKTRDYTQRLIDFGLSRKRTSSNGAASNGAATHDLPDDDEFPLVIDVLRAEGYMSPAADQPVEDEPFDVTREPLRFPTRRSARLQVLARGETGAMLSIAYAGMRGYGGAHGYIGELRQGDLPVVISHPVTGKHARIGRVPVTECYQVVGGQATKADERPDYTMGYGIVVGRNERKAISMSIIDGSLKKEHKSDNAIEDEEYVLHHIDAVEAMGFVEHLKLPHYVDFQASLQRTNSVRKLVQAARTNA